MRSIDGAERRARLGIRHHLAKPCTDGPVTIARDMVGLHSSDPATVYLAVWARSPEGFVPQHLEQSLYEDRELLRVLGMRMTMFVAPPDLAALLDTACAKPLSGPQHRRLARMLEEQEITTDGAAWVDGVSDQVLTVLHERGPSTANELKAEVPELENQLRFGEGSKWAGTFGVSTRILFLMACQGRIVRAQPLGSWISTQYRWAAINDWLPKRPQVPDGREAEIQLIRRWLRSFGPGTLADVKWWTGWGLRRVRAALSAAGAVEVDLGGHAGFVSADDIGATDNPDPWVALLPSLDSTVMGWKERAWYLGDKAALLFDRNGNAGPTVWSEGRVVGGWAQRSDGEVAFRLVEDTGTEAESAIKVEAERLQAWLGETRVTPRFSTPLQKELER